MFEEISEFIKFGVLIVAIAVFLGLLAVWILSVAMTFLSHYNFTIELDKEDIIITRGLLEKKRVTVPLKTDSKCSRRRESIQEVVRLRLSSYP